MLSQQNKKLLVSGLGASLFYFKRGFILYGVWNDEHLEDVINKVVSVIGGGENAKKLLWETATAESERGTYPVYNPFRDYGLGVMQFDKVGFLDTKERTSQANKDKIKKAFGYDINQVKYEDLRFSVELSVIFARLKYWLVPSPIPSTLQGRAEYWKTWYNSEYGAGTPHKYIAKNGG